MTTTAPQAVPASENALRRVWLHVRGYHEAMRYVRRHDLSPRVEMIPLIDVIFLLLTFFIYSLTVMVQAQVLPVKLAPVTTGTAARPAEIAAITLDLSGALYLNREPIDAQALDAALREMAEQETPPLLFLAMQSPAAEDDSPAFIDRGPLLVELIERVRRAGLTDFTIVGPPQ